MLGWELDRHIVLTHGGQARYRERWDAAHLVALLFWVFETRWTLPGVPHVLRIREGRAVLDVAAMW